MRDTYEVAATKIMTLNEIRRVVEDLEQRRNHRVQHWATNAWANRIIFRLSTCCGLRKKEIRHIRLDDMLLGGDRPAIRIRKEATKGRPHQRRSRMVPLWWDQGTFQDIAEWVQWRRATNPPNALVMRADWTTRSNEVAQAELMPERKISKRWKSAIRTLGDERESQLGVHAGRHTFCTLAVQAGRSLKEVQNAAGHASISMTNNYLHVIDNKCGDVFDFSFLDEED